jgi:copper oxidase (laccase) domain-containing protein
MIREFDTRPRDLFAGISPSIGACHYPVGRDVINAFEDAFGAETTGGFLKKQSDDEARLDLWACNRQQLADAGVRGENVETAGVCTVCQNDLFFSHRAESGQTGRFAGIIMLHSASARAY